MSATGPRVLEVVEDKHSGWRSPAFCSPWQRSKLRSLAMTTRSVLARLSASVPSGACRGLGTADRRGSPTGKQTNSGCRPEASTRHGATATPCGKGLNQRSICMMTCQDAPCLSRGSSGMWPEQNEHSSPEPLASGITGYWKKSGCSSCSIGPGGRPRRRVSAGDDIRPWFFVPLRPSRSRCPDPFLQLQIS